jgi:hypothetical protein
MRYAAATKIYRERGVTPMPVDIHSRELRIVGHDNDTVLDLRPIRAVRIATGLAPISLSKSLAQMTLIVI